MSYNPTAYTKLLDLMISSLTIISEFTFDNTYSKGIAVTETDIENLQNKIAQLTTYRDQIIRDFKSAFNSSPEILKMINEQVQ